MDRCSTWRRTREFQLAFLTKYQLCYTQEDFATAAPAFNEFLSRFPLCYMYWKKYADLAAKNVGDDRAREVGSREWRSALTRNRFMSAVCCMRQLASTSGATTALSWLRHLPAPQTSQPSSQGQWVA